MTPWNCCGSSPLRRATEKAGWPVRRPVSGGADELRLVPVPQRLEKVAIGKCHAWIDRIARRRQQCLAVGCCSTMTAVTCGNGRIMATDLVAQLRLAGRVWPRRPGRPPGRSRARRPACGCPAPWSLARWTRQARGRGPVVHRAGPTAMRATAAGQHQQRQQQGSHGETVIGADRASALPGVAHAAVASGLVTNRRPGLARTGGFSRLLPQHVTRHHAAQRSGDHAA